MSLCQQSDHSFNNIMYGIYVMVNHDVCMYNVAYSTNTILKVNSRDVLNSLLRRNECGSMSKLRS